MDLILINWYKTDAQNPIDTLSVKFVFFCFQIDMHMNKQFLIS